MSPLEFLFNKYEKNSSAIIPFSYHEDYAAISQPCVSRIKYLYIILIQCVSSGRSF